MRRGGPLRRTPFMRRYDAEKAAARREWRDAVMSRAHGLCEAERLEHDCAGWAHEAHHIVPRGRGGRDELDNGMAVCRQAHFVIHHVSPQAAKDAGYLKSY